MHTHQKSSTKEPYQKRPTDILDTRSDARCMRPIKETCRHQKSPTKEPYKRALQKSPTRREPLTNSDIQRRTPSSRAATNETGVLYF